MLIGYDAFTVKTLPSSSSESDTKNISAGFSNIHFPSPDLINLGKEGRFYQRFLGNIEYLKYLYEHYGQEMIDAYRTRNYSPGKLLERMWDGEYAGKWLDAAVRSGVNLGDQEILNFVDIFIDSLINHQQSDGYMGIKPPVDRELNDWENTWDLWNQWNSMIGFLSNYEFRGHDKSLIAAKKIADWIIYKFTPINKYKEKLFEENVTGGFTNAVLNLGITYKSLDPDSI